MIIELVDDSDLRLEEILERIDDPSLNDVFEIQDKIDLTRSQLKEILIRLDNIGFVDYDQDNEIVQITELGSEFLELPDGNNEKGGMQ